MGLKHSGKTTFASMHSGRTSLLFADADYLVMKMIRPLSVRDFYRTRGKTAFQEIEYEAVDDFLLSIDKPFVMSLGGGASDNDRLLRRIRKEGHLIYLHRREDDMLPVILKDGIPPFLDENDPMGSFHELFSRRDRIYRENADLIIDLGPYRDMDDTYNVIEAHLKEAHL